MQFKNLIILVLLLSIHVVFSQPAKFTALEDADDHLKHGNYFAAIPIYKAELKKEPGDAEIKYKLGLCYLNTRLNRDEAVTMLEKARALRPLDGMIADSVGWAYYKLARYQEAARTLEEAVQLAPGASDINDHLGDAYWRIGRRIDARFQWQHALQLEPDEKQKEVIERKLQFGLDAVSASGQ